MNSPQDKLAARIRPALADHHVREVAMFGGLSFMVDDRIVVSAGRDGDLLVRIDPARHGELLGVAGAREAVMGADRPMGDRWIRVDHAGIATPESLDFWIQVALDHHSAANDDRHRG